MDIKHDSYLNKYKSFRWDLPKTFNFGRDVVDAWAAKAPDRDALIWCDESGREERYTFSDISDVSPHTIEKIRYFFQHYKDLENKKVTVGNFLNSEKAYKILANSICKPL